MNGDQKPRQRNSLLGCLIATLVLVVVLGALVAAGWVLYGAFPARSTPSGSLQVNPNLSQVQRLYLEYVLSQNKDRLQQPIGSGTEPVPFTVAPGEGAGRIAANLVAAGLLDDTELFLNYLAYYGLDGGLVAGEYLLDPQLTIPALAETIGSGRSRTLSLNFLPGWRSEEMANYLRVVRPARIDADEFSRIVRTRQGIDSASFVFLRNLPPDSSLEGYLFPTEYPITLVTTSSDLVEAMLAEFDRRVTPDMRQSFGVAGLTLHEAVILASIIEREATIADEKPFMAGVFLNRLRAGMPIQADPTVQYALGFQPAGDTWWKSPLDAVDLQVNSPYNTYLVNGLPPGPIANPGLDSLNAVANPAGTAYLFFVLDCFSPEVGRHIFSVTYDEHLANVQRCR